MTLATTVILYKYIEETTKDPLISILYILVKPRHQHNSTVRSKLTAISKSSVSFDGALARASSGTVSHKIMASPLLSLILSNIHTPPPLPLTTTGSEVRAPSLVHTSHSEATPSTALLLLAMFTSVLNGNGDLYPELRWASFLTSIPHCWLLLLPPHPSPSQKGSPSHLSSSG
jgi:hypothetical protein